MPIKDFITKLWKWENNFLTVHWTTWTEIQSGMITEDYNSDLQFPESIEIYDEMRKSDATVIAILRAIKQPLVSAKWQVQAWWDDEQDKLIAEFVRKNIFENVKFKHFLRESLWFLDFWFYYFEKVFKVVDGKIEWKELSPRVPRSHYLWGISNQKEWIDGHPAWVTQQILTTDEAPWSQTKEIPWEKIVLFSFEKEWNNFEWVSLLRNAYKHYFYKDLLYKIESISAERYGVWVPTAKVKSTMNDANKKKVEEFLKNIRSNEQSYGVYNDDVELLEILTPSGSWVWTTMQSAIAHHDRKIYDSILAGFLNLTTWEGGSNALSKDQSSFFLRWLQWIADFWIDTMNQHIKELVDMNWNWIKKYPKITVSDIGSISMDEQINAISSAISWWMLEPNQNDKNDIRAILKLSPLPSPDEEDMELDKLETELELEQMQINTLESFENETLESQIDSDVQKTEEEKQTDIAMSEIFEETLLLGYTMTQEHKDKIAKAIENLKIESKDPEKITIKSQKDFLAWDKEVQGYEKERIKVKSMIDAVKAAMESLRSKKVNMSREDKKKFAVEFKTKIEELRQSRISLQNIWKNLKSKKTDRENYLKAYRKEVTSQIKNIKSSAKQKERDRKKQERADLKAKKEAERMAKKKQKEDEKNKKHKQLSEKEWDYTWCVMLNVSSKKIDAFKIDDKDLFETEYNWDTHVTLLYWLNTSIPEDNIIEKINYGWQKVIVKWMKIFESEENDVLVLECKKEKWLMDINSSLRELDYKSDYPEYIPHITLAYCKKWEAKKYLSDEFDWIEIDTGKIVYTSNTESKPKTLLFSEKIKVSTREKTFSKNITEFESYLLDVYDKIEDIIIEYENEVQDAISELYDESESERIDGVVCLVYDKKKITEWKNIVKKLTDKLEKKLIDSDIQDEVFKQAVKLATTTLDDNEKQLSYEVDRWQINTFIEWYKSNMQGVIYNESRRVLENITLNYGSEASLELAKQTAAEISINKNILMLSYITHPRAAYKFIIYNEAQKQGFTMFKTLVPTDKLQNVIDRPLWMTATLIFTIKTAAQINQTASVMTAWKTAEAVTGLWLHHGSFEYYYPIASSDLDVEEEISKMQREEFQKKIDENKTKE